MQPLPMPAPSRDACEADPAGGGPAAVLLPPFDLSERDARLQRIWQGMRESGVAALVLTCEPNFRYVTEFRSPTWVSSTRPRYAIVPADGLPIAVVPASNTIAAAASGWVGDIRSWPAPRPQDDGVTLVLEAVQAAAAQGGRVAFELGAGSRLGMAGSDFLRLVDAIGRDRLCDAVPIMDRVRCVKSAAEIARHRLAAAAASAALSRLPDIARSCATDRDLQRALRIALFEAHAGGVPYLVCAAGRGGYAATNLEAGGREFRAGDIVYVDVGATVDGYYSDFNRHVAFGRVDEHSRAACRVVHEALEAGLAAARPGKRLCDVWHAMARILERHGGEATGIGRLGHAIGLSLTEAPSITPDDTAVLAPGMVLAVEPGLAYRPAEDGGPPRLMVQEENIVILEEGAVLTSRRGPSEIPVIC